LVSGATVDFIREVATLAQIDAEALLARHPSRATWYARSVDSTYLTGKRVFIFGDASHAIAAARFAARELGFTVVGLGTYSREFAREIREAAKLYDIEALITDDYLDVEERVAELQPELVLRHSNGSATLQSVSGCLAQSFRPRFTCRIFPRDMPRRWASRVPMCSSTPGFIRS
jgi:nitrogenase molybdenum-iron protein alpha/beta subunit